MILTKLFRQLFSHLCKYWFSVPPNYSSFECEEATFVQSAILKRPNVRQQVELFTCYSLMHIWNAQIWPERFKSRIPHNLHTKTWFGLLVFLRKLQKGESEALKSLLKNKYNFCSAIKVIQISGTIILHSDGIMKYCFNGNIYLKTIKVKGSHN